MDGAGASKAGELASQAQVCHHPRLWRSQVRQRHLKVLAGQAQICRHPRVLGDRVAADIPKIWSGGVVVGAVETYQRPRIRCLLDAGSIRAEKDSAQAILR